MLKFSDRPIVFNAYGIILQFIWNTKIVSRWKGRETANKLDFNGYHSQFKRVCWMMIGNILKMIFKPTTISLLNLNTKLYYHPFPSCSLQFKHPLISHQTSFPYTQTVRKKLCLLKAFSPIEVLLHQTNAPFWIAKWAAWQSIALYGVDRPYGN